ncbi:hypothetical protein GOBAR_AA18421 [Gossypium barbadense]|uniref:Uncharacterized protein n=1 Tax=Gossypium barbadense TaxID=3634 RepID=A0A2P5XFW7_GOSBA|nr:hypothetical protein GOBAR_AA18421 [Gossypium barbadense]
MWCLLNALGEHVATNERERFLLHETLANSKITIDRTEIIDGDIKVLDKINAHPAPTQHRVELLVIGSSISGLNMLEREHRAYAFLARCCLSTTVGDCISEATIASSTDNYLWENICNTLEPRDRVARTASYWSSKGQKNPVVPETLTYRLIADLYVVTEIKIRPFQAYFQFGYLIYSAKSVRFRMGHIKDADESCHDSGTDRFAWTYTSQEFEMAQENCLQTFKLPESCQDSGADRI